jgi:hypothetical protein
MNKTTSQPLWSRPLWSRPLWVVMSLLVVGVMLLSGCTFLPFQAMPGEVITQEMDFADFDQVEISDAFAVEIRQGDEFQVTISVDAESRRFLDVNQHGDTLEIGMRSRPLTFFWLFNTVHRAEITMPTLVGVSVSDASHVTVSGFRSDAETRFEIADASSLDGEIETGDTRITLSDASKLSLEGNRGNVEIEVGDASNVTLVGEGRNLTVRAANASRVNLAEFRVQDADLRSQDASHITVDVAGKLDAEADDASSIVYDGDPTMGNITSSDASSVRARD